MSTFKQILENNCYVCVPNLEPQISVKEDMNTSMCHVSSKSQHPEYALNPCFLGDEKYRILRQFIEAVNIHV